MVIKIIILVLIAAIFYALGSGLYYLVVDGGQSKRMVKALMWRLILALLLFGFLIVAYWIGWIHPHGLQLELRPKNIPTSIHA